MKKKNLILILTALFLLISITLVAQAVNSFNSLSNSSKLEKNIIESTQFGSSEYSFQKFTDQEIKDLTSEKQARLIDSSMAQGSNEKKLKEIDAEVLAYSKNLKEQKSTVKYFYMTKDQVEYFISFEHVPGKDPYCRLAVKSNAILVLALNSAGVLLSENLKHHSINKNICNGLYGYGKPSY